MNTLTRKTLTTTRSLHYTYCTSPTPISTDNPALLFLHGFPDSSFLWNDILIHLTNNGVLSTHKVIVPDMLGYAGTSKPLNSSLYNYRSVSSDLIEILDAETIHKVILIGHDWGAGLAQRFYPFYTDRVDRIILLNIAYFMPAKIGDPKFDLKAANEMMEAAFGAPLWTYWEFFTAEDGPEVMRANLQRFYEAQHGDVEDWGFKIFCVPGAWRRYLTGSESVSLKPYAQQPRWKDSFFEQFTRDDFEAPIQWYKAMIDGVQHEVEIQIPPEKHRIEVPVLFVGCTQDGNNRVEMIEPPQKAGLLPKLRIEILECGHWSPMEKPAEVAGFIADFIDC